ncbi:MAG: phosphatidylserine decarboxylase family protein [Bernardetiaceae bacterium]|nr:phosphatidylserine decarboxylase family protein [Bernardetiaceae bacterium]
MRIHKEGHQMLIILGVVLSSLNVGVFFATDSTNLIFGISLSLSLIIFLLVLQFFRHPKVHITATPYEVLAPAEGKVVVIEETEETEYFNDRRIQISIFMSPINVHVNRNPIAGVVKYVKYHAGKYLVAWHPKSSTENERTTIVVRNEEGVEILMRQIAGALARRIKWYVAEQDSVQQGKEFGFIKFGSRVDVFLPIGTDIKVAIGDRTQGGKTVLAELKS